MARIVFLASLLLTACVNPLGSGSHAGNAFAPGAPSTASDPTTPAPAGVGADTGMKAGPGTLQAASASFAAKASVTNSDAVFSSAHFRARLSLSKQVLR